jgi:hypothetical protein
VLPSSASELKFSSREHLKIKTVNQKLDPFPSAKSHPNFCHCNMTRNHYWSVKISDSLATLSKYDHTPRADKFNRSIAVFTIAVHHPRRNILECGCGSFGHCNECDPFAQKCTV